MIRFVTHCRTVVVPPIVLIVALLSALPGCPAPDLGDAPFLCNNGEPRCPEGYECRGKVCVREGLGAADSGLVADRSEPSLDTPWLSEGRPQPDGRTPQLDQAHPADQKLPSPDQPQGPAQIQISEFMANPYMPLESDGEWLELHNLGAQAVDINGWTLKDKGVDSHVINAGGALLIPAAGYVVLGRSKDQAANGGVAVSYAYGSAFNLSNTADEIVLVNKTGTVIDSVSYATSSGWTIPDGSSLSLKKNAGSNHNDPTSWCRETWPWPGSDGDEGTPGQPPGC